MKFFSFLTVLLSIASMVCALPLAMPDSNTPAVQNIRTNLLAEDIVRDFKGYLAFLSFLQKYLDDTTNSQVVAAPVAEQAPAPIAHAAQDTSNNNNQDAPVPQGDFHGEATFYTPGLGSCGENSGEGDFIAAINAPQFDGGNKGGMCGRCASIHGPSGNSVKVRVVDRCASCQQGDLDLSPAAFEKLASRDDGRIKVNWSFTDC